MAGITTSCSLKPVPCRKTTPSPLTLSSSDSKFFSFRVRDPNFNSLVSLSSTLATTPINSRYGGGGGGGSRYSGPDSRRSRQSDSEDEQALDLSTIRSDSVRLIDEQQNMVGVVSKAEALRMAEGVELDLVILSPDADPPVVRIMDYNKYRYEQQKKKRGQQKKSAATRMDLKELKMGYNIDQHDYSVRLKSAQKFLKDGDKVKVVVNLKGRENEFRNIAIELIKRFQNDVGELATEESKNFRDRNMSIVLVPNKAVLQKGQEPAKKKDKSEAVNEVSASI
ncbi:translation initiation factor IF3-4, chloroplastic isoform X2 [Morus notabilis]|uniref:translation initiation factor IF3-4, chloroplastic isoform X1 n=1 Tax=Morus notabilis TaxID=981085 RepID=UPI000CED5A86|nr:translation initiation factor IF3-4, chloroplastic isoform X1 [Morus notabilis]XP_024017959.1 translation initiation factor IF3-4, chloroplastic isoform X2 [Morus notabilis]